MHTRAALTYLDHHVTHLRLALASQLAFAAGPLLEKRNSDSDGLERLGPALAQFSRVYRSPEDVASFQREIMEVLVARSVDNFNCYLADVFSELFRVKPEILTSSQKIDVAHVMACASLEELYSVIAERKVDELAYGGFKIIRKFLVERVGIRDFADGAVLLSTTEAIAARNLIVHNRGRVNDRFISETGRTDLAKGQELPLSHDDTERFEDALLTIVRHVDSEVIVKFGNNVFGPRVESPARTDT